jgi:Conserved secreted protein
MLLPNISFRNISPVTVLLLFITLLLNGCSSLEKLEPPTVTLVSIKPVTSSAMLPTFNIELRLSNPNEIAIPLRSVRYELFLNKSKVVTGSGNDLPTLPAHGDAIVTISAIPEVTGAMALAGQFLLQQPTAMEYHFRAELDPAIALPTLHFERTGEIKLPRMK